MIMKSTENIYHVKRQKLHFPHTHTIKTKIKNGSEGVVFFGLNWEDITSCG